jgi:exonuclease VII small subunit
MANLSTIVKELQQERDRLDKAIAALTSLDGASTKTSARRTMSASARRRIAAAQRARWARQKSTAQNSGAARPKRRISAAGIARIRAAAKARWAKVRAAKKH